MFIIQFIRSLLHSFCFSALHLIFLFITQIVYDNGAVVRHSAGLSLSIWKCEYMDAMSDGVRLRLRMGVSSLSRRWKCMRG